MGGGSTSPSDQNSGFFREIGSAGDILGGKFWIFSVISLCHCCFFASERYEIS